MQVKRIAVVAIVALGFVGTVAARANPQPATQPAAVVNAAIDRVAGLLRVPESGAAQVFSATVKVTRAEGLPKELNDASVELAVQAPGHLFLNASVRGNQYTAARAGDALSIYVPEKKFGVVGVPGVARFKSDPSSVDNTRLGPLALPIKLSSLRLPLMLMQYELLADESIDGESCYVVKIAAPEKAAALLKLPPGAVELAVRKSDSVPARVRFSDGRANVEVVVRDIAFSQDRPAELWKPTFKAGDTVETVAVSHLSRCIAVMHDNLTTRIPTLGPARGYKRLAGVSGNGRLEIHDGTRVLFLKGTPEEMGRQQGELLKAECLDLIERVMYGVGVGSSFAKGKWFFGEIESAHARLAPFISQRTYREIDAMADAVGVSRTEARLANFFPELFHCSGFSLTGDATVDGRMYHGRILDYLKGVGLEQNAVVMVYQPEVGNAWVNVGYAGFVGTVTAMNEKHISIGEMGGRGEGNWDGKPMAQLLREVMENAGTLEEAVEIMRKGPRTCEYYYVISDGKSKKAVGIAATPEKFETVYLGQTHPLLPHGVKDAVLLSAGDRYEKLVERVKTNYGKIDAAGARELMTRPVAMPSCIHAVLFAPDNLDFWVANADSQNVASHTRYTQYNLRELLDSNPAK